MPFITIRNEDGHIVEQEIISRSAIIAEFDADEAGLASDDLDPILEPAVPQRVEYDDRGGMSSITTVCGETETRRSSDEGIRYTFEGIITKSQLNAAKRIGRGDNLTLISDVHSGPIVVQRVTIEQNNDLVSFKEDGDAEGELAFAFQMQFEEPDTA